MFSVITHEIRWFYPGEIPAALYDWHKGLDGLYQQHETRTDLYLLLSGNADQGIKYREGRIEVKKRLADLGLVRTSSATGNAELWKKWSFKTEKGEHSFNPGLFDPENWIGVRKKRYLQLFAFDQNNELMLHPGIFGEGETVMVELSDVEFNENHWWTLGIEFTVQHSDTKTNSHDLVNRLLADFPDLKLDALASFGYPQWLTVRFKT
ncbi:MAG: hypothetical protein ACNA7V_13835 [Bacteroidales bacterium]